MLKISPNGQQNILECMHRIGVLPESPCNGKGLCGKCKVRIVSGKVSEPTLQEQKLLTQQELSEGVRLACLTLPLEELQIDALDLMSEQLRPFCRGDAEAESAPCRCIKIHLLGSTYPCKGYVSVRSIGPSMYS